MQRWKFFNENGEKRARLVNPPLIIANPKGGKKKMAKVIQMKRNRYGQFVKARASNPPKKKHHKRRKNWYGAGAVVPAAAKFMVNNPKHHKKHRRNPPMQVAGIPIPNLEETLMIGVGVAVGLGGPPIIRGLITGMLPAGTLPPAAPAVGPAAPATTSQTIAGVALTGAAYGLPLLGGYMIGGRTGLKYVAAGEMASFLVQMLQSAAASISSSLPAPAVAGYTNQRVFQRPGGVAGYIPAKAANLKAFPLGQRSLQRGSRFGSPRH
jgi:hypothetical protein